MLERQAKRLRSRRRPVRVYMDGCFDLAHFGHANALRQAKACGDVLVVGLVPDREILRCKGPPVLEEAERRAVIESLRWVDELIEDVPYDINPEFMRELYDKHNIDYIVHGDDPCLLPDGTDAYDAPKRAGRFKMIKRTEGISTTNSVERCLRVSGDESIRDIRAEEPSSSITTTVASHFCTTARRVTQFSGGGRAPPRRARGVRARRLRPFSLGSRSIPRTRPRARRFSHRGRARGRGGARAAWCKAPRAQRAGARARGDGVSTRGRGDHRRAGASHSGSSRRSTSRWSWPRIRGGWVVGRSPSTRECASGQTGRRRRRRETATTRTPRRRRLGCTRNFPGDGAGRRAHHRRHHRPHRGESTRVRGAKREKERLGGEVLRTEVRRGHRTRRGVVSEEKSRATRRGIRRRAAAGAMGSTEREA